MSERILFLIRHGRSDFGSEDFRRTPRGDQYDPPLDQTGREQAELLAARLLLMQRPAAVYCSPFRRARETIEPYAAAAGITVEFDDDLGEAFIGEWENTSFAEIMSRDGAMLERYRNQDPIWRHAPGAEPLESLRARVRSAVEAMIDRHPEGNVLVVAHGGVINAYVGAVLGLEQEMFFLPDNTSLNSIVVAGRDRQVRFLNDVRHLSEPQLFRPD